MAIYYTDTQIRRLKELGAVPSEIAVSFEDEAARDKRFRERSKDLLLKERQRLADFRSRQQRPGLCVLENRLCETLTAHGFVQVTTPIIMSAGLLAKMNIDAGHPLNSQIFWLNAKQCLRPMLAPHLYYMVKDLLRLWEKPVRLFEVGPCFRKESQGAAHSNEFTMLNLAEFGLPEDQRQNRIEELAKIILKTADIDAFRFESESSEVYGDTLDVVSGENGLELGSGAMGPHPLDANWRILETWVGIGFGLERLLMATRPNANLSKLGRSLTYLDGIRLNI